MGRSVDCRAMTAIPRRSLADQVAEGILALILDGPLAEGAPLPTTAELAARFDVSAVVVREAMAALAGAASSPPPRPRGGPWRAPARRCSTPSSASAPARTRPRSRRRCRCAPRSSCRSKRRSRRSADDAADLRAAQIEAMLGARSSAALARTTTRVPRGARGASRKPRRCTSSSAYRSRRSSANDRRQRTCGGSVAEHGLAGAAPRVSLELVVDAVDALRSGGGHARHGRPLRVLAAAGRARVPRRLRAATRRSRPHLRGLPASGRFWNPNFQVANSEVPRCTTRQPLRLQGLEGKVALVTRCGRRDRPADRRRAGGAGRCTRSRRRTSPRRASTARST